MHKSIISVLLSSLLTFLVLPSTAYAVCPNQISDTDITIINGNTCTIPAGQTYVLDKATGEESSTNTAQLTVSGGSLTISNTATLHTATLVPSGGSIIIQDGGIIKIGGTTGAGIWVTDADADGYVANFTTYTATAAGRRRVALMKSKTASDCNDSNISRWQNIAGYIDADSDGYGTGSSQQVCSGSSLLAGYVTNNTDCNDTSSTYRTSQITGGTITTVGTDKVHTFTSSGTLQVSCPSSINVRALVVGGGAGPLAQGGGGGGGAIDTTFTLASGTHTITVAGAVLKGTNGQASYLGGYLSKSGGYDPRTSYGGTSGDGYAGGIRQGDPLLKAGGGGGGARGTGLNGAFSIGGSGGAGLYSDISGSNVGYGGGGAATGINGDGSAWGSSYGRGGNGSEYYGGSGNSGIIIVRYANPL